MKQLFFLIAFFIGFNFSVYAQWEYPFMYEFFFGHVTGKRTEAMGKAYAPTEMEVNCIFKNPAGLGISRGLTTELSTSAPYGAAEKARYFYTGVGYTINKYLSVGVAMNRFSFGEIYFTDPTGYIMGKASPYEVDYAFAFASQPVKNFYLGANLNYLELNYPMIESKGAFYPDIGAIKLFEIGDVEKLKHKLFIGQSFSDFTKSSIKTSTLGIEYKNELPFISRTQVGYSIIIADSAITKNQEATFIFEYEEVLNSKYQTAIRFGIEYKLFKIIALRGGYYRFNVYDFGLPEYNKSDASSFTYGFGIILPFESISKNKLPLTLKFDFVNLQFPRYTQDDVVLPFEIKRFTGIGLSVNYIFKKSN
jgi:hypothetical protein